MSAYAISVATVEMQSVLPVESVHDQQGGLVGHQGLSLHDVLQAVVSVRSARVHRQRRRLRDGHDFVSFANKKDLSEDGRLVSVVINRLVNWSFWGTGNKQKYRDITCALGATEHRCS